MGLIEYNLFGEKTDKVKTSIERIKNMQQPEEGYFVAYSGGKDSVVLDAIMEMAGVKYDRHYSVTTVDPPELVRFIIKQHDTILYNHPDGTQTIYSTYGKRLLNQTNQIKGKVIHFDLPEETMRQLIIRKCTPPTRIMRYCCEKLKETHGVGRITITGVRWAESANRKKNQGVVTFLDGSAKKIAEEQGINFTKTMRGGLFLTWIMMRAAAWWNYATVHIKLL